MKVNFSGDLKSVLDLSWGDFIDNPCHSVFGIVLGLVLDSECKEICFLVNFGNYLGIQEVPLSVCNAWSPPTMTSIEMDAINGVIATAQLVPYNQTDAAVVEEMPPLDELHSINVNTAVQPPPAPPLSSKYANVYASVEDIALESDPEWTPPLEAC